MTKKRCARSHNMCVYLKVKLKQTERKIISIRSSRNALTKIVLFCPKCSLLISNSTLYTSTVSLHCTAHTHTHLHNTIHYISIIKKNVPEFYIYIFIATKRTVQCVNKTNWKPFKIFLIVNEIIHSELNTLFSVSLVLLSTKFQFQFQFHI